MPFADGRIRPLSRNAQMVGYFGQPCDNDNLTLVTLPIIGRAYLHEKVAPAYVRVFDEIKQAGQERLIDRDSFGGTYCCRNVRGSSAKSPHSWAVAIDLNTDHIMREGREVTGTSNFRCSAAQVATSLKLLEPFFTAWGFSWGGFWRSYLDPMHFEATEFTLAIIAGKPLPADVRATVDAARAQIGKAPAATKHDPPLVIAPDGKVAAVGAIVNDRLVAPVAHVVGALGYGVSWHGEQGKGYIVKEATK